MIIYFTTNSKIWLVSVLNFLPKQHFKNLNDHLFYVKSKNLIAEHAYSFFIAGPSAGGAAEISDPNSIIKNEMIVYFTSNSKIWLVSVLNLWSK